MRVLCVSLSVVELVEEVFLPALVTYSMELGLWVLLPFAVVME